MSAKRLTTEYLQEIVEMFKNSPPINDKQVKWLSCCEKELKRRWGIKQ